MAACLLLASRGVLFKHQRFIFAHLRAALSRSSVNSALSVPYKPIVPLCAWSGGASLCYGQAVRHSSSAVVKDVLLFEHDRTRFFRLLVMFCGGQLVFWTSLAYVAFTSLRDTSRNPQKVRTELGLFSLDMKLGSDAWRFGFTLSCLLIGGGIVGLGVLYSRRSVSRVLLHKGGETVTVCTQSPLGADKAWRLTVPLSQVACHAHRQESPSFIPLKVKDHKLYFLLDKDGTLNNHKLFDVTVGAYRPL